MSFQLRKGRDRQLPLPYLTLCVLHERIARNGWQVSDAASNNLNVGFRALSDVL